MTTKPYIPAKTQQVFQPPHSMTQCGTGYKSAMTRKKTTMGCRSDPIPGWSPGGVSCAIVCPYSSSNTEAAQTSDDCNSTMAHSWYMQKGHAGTAYIVEWFHNWTGEVEPGDSDQLWKTKGTCPQSRVERGVIKFLGFLWLPCVIPQPEHSKHPTLLTPCNSTTVYMGHPWLGKRLDLRKQRNPGSRVEPEWCSGNHCWHPLKQLLRSHQIYDGDCSTTAHLLIHKKVPHELKPELQICSTTG